MTATLKGAGATVAASLTKKVTHVLSTDADVAAKTAKVVKAMGWGIPIVAESFVNDSLAANAAVPVAPHALPRGSGSHPVSSSKRKASAAVKAAATKASKKSKAVSSKASSKCPQPTAKKPSKAAAAPARQPRGPKVDDHVPQRDKYAVHGDYEATLNQVNLGSNNNKFFILQLLEGPPGRLSLYTRYGRVGEVGKADLKPGSVKDFESKFRSKTKNAWSARHDFVKHAGKYDLMQMDADDDDLGLIPDTDDGVHGPCTLAPPVAEFVKLIFDKDMFKSQMSQTFRLDTSKLPLGKLSKAQLAKGMQVLNKLGAEIQTRSRQTSIEELSSEFYTVIPHASTRNTKLPLITTPETIQQKKDMVAALADIEQALSMQKEEATGTTQQHPLDQSYRSLAADLEALDPASAEYKMIQTFAERTQAPAAGQGGWIQASSVRRTLLDVLRVNRHGEAERYAAFDGVGNRRLLWHGTNVAVVAAIMKSGLRIMPHSGGRVGRGIYLASENCKSASYVRPDYSSRTGVMFLCEAACGRMHTITRDDSSLRAAPAGYDSVKAVGRSEPDPSCDTVLEIDGEEVLVAQGAPVPQAEGSGSSFSQSEYLLYREEQVRIRYVLTFRWGV